MHQRRNPDQGLLLGNIPDGLYSAYFAQSHERVIRGSITKCDIRNVVCTSTEVFLHSKLLVGAHKHTRSSDEAGGIAGFGDLNLSAHHGVHAQIILQKRLHHDSRISRHHVPMSASSKQFVAHRMHVFEVEFGQHGSGGGLDGRDFESSAGDKDEQANPGSFGHEMVKNVNQWGD